MHKNQFSLLVAIVLAIFIATACTSGQRRQQPPTTSEAMTLAEDPTTAPIIIKDPQPAFPLEPEKPPQSRVPRLGLILGPGGVKAFAHAGVLKKLTQAKIPVHAVAGIGWGSLVGAFFSEKGQPHQVEWKLYKLEKKDIGHSHSFFSGSLKITSVKSLRPYLQDNLGAIQIQNMKIKFMCPATSIWSGVVVVHKRGSLRRAIEHCLPAPPLYKAHGPWYASGFSLQKVADQLRTYGADIVVFVNVLGRGKLLSQQELLKYSAASLMWQELKSFYRQKHYFLDETVSVNTTAFSLYDYKNRPSLVRAGEKTGDQLVNTLVEKYRF